MSSKIRVLLGPPGTGKTTTLLSRIEGLLASGVQPSEIAFVSYTKAATSGAITKASERFNLDPGAFAYFKTIHAMALMAMGSRQSVMGAAEWKDFGESCNYSFTGSASDEGIALSFDEDGDCLRSIDAMARVTQTTVGRAILRCGEVPAHITEAMVFSYQRRLAQWKADNGKIDFEDMLEAAFLSNWRPSVRFAFIDEAQDSNRLQNALVHHWFVENERCELVTYAGDDDQQIYGWSGAEYGALQGLARACVGDELCVLEHSWRVPASAHGVAQGIIKQNRNRIAKAYSPRDGDPGRVLLARDMADALSMVEDGDTFALVRNNKYAKDMRDGCLAAGVMFRAETGETSPLQRKGPSGAFAAVKAWRGQGNASADEFRYLLGCIPSEMQAANEDGSMRKVTLIPKGAKTAAKANTDAVPFWRARDEFKLSASTLDHLTGERPFEIMQKGMSGPERAYLTRILDRGASIGSPVTITSMHRSKGLERRNVIICPDMVYRTARARDASQVGFEEENCVAYVAATRTLSTLIVLGVNDRNWYDYSRLVRQRG